MFKNLCSSGLRFIWISGLVIFFDRLSKAWVSHNLTPYEPVSIFPIFNLTLAHNRGAAFSFLNQAGGWQHFFLGGIAVIVSLFLIVCLIKQTARERWLNIAFCLIVGGAIGNVWDRITHTYVIDFLDFHWETWHFATFNLADSAISIGAIMLIFHWLFLDKHLNKR